MENYVMRMVEAVKIRGYSHTTMSHSQTFSACRALISPPNP